MIIGGYRVPKGTLVQLPIYAMQVSAANYVQPFKFWPERWSKQADCIVQDKGILHLAFLMHIYLE